MGGYMFNPPMACPYKAISEDEGIWTDYAMCLVHCLEYCKKYLAFIHGRQDEADIIKRYNERRKKAKLPPIKSPKKSRKTTPEGGEDNGK